MPTGHPETPEQAAEILRQMGLPVPAGGVSISIPMTNGPGAQRPVGGQ